MNRAGSPIFDYTGRMLKEAKLLNALVECVMNLELHAEYAAPDGAWTPFWAGIYKDFAPRGAVPLKGIGVAHGGG